MEIDNNPADNRCQESNSADQRKNCNFCAEVHRFWNLSGNKKTAIRKTIETIAFLRSIYNIDPRNLVKEHVSASREYVTWLVSIALVSSFYNVSRNGDVVVRTKLSSTQRKGRRSPRFLEMWWDLQRVLTYFESFPNWLLIQFSCIKRRESPTTTTEGSEKSGHEREMGKPIEIHPVHGYSPQLFITILPQEAVKKDS